MSVRILTGDAVTMLRDLPDASVNCCVTSPPYYGLRDYGMDGQIGLEETPDAFVARLVEVFREVRRVLRDDGTLWLNIGDSYSTHAAGKVANPMAKSTLAGVKTQEVANSSSRAQGKYLKCASLPEKNLIGIPWRLAFALQSDGWYLRQDIIWHKPNPMPESVTDRCTKSHEYVFLLAKSSRYFYDAKAISEEVSASTIERWGTATPQRKTERVGNLPKSAHSVSGESTLGVGSDGTRNKRSVWSIGTQPYSAAHFATMAPELADTCIKAGCPRHCCSQCGAPANFEFCCTCAVATTVPGTVLDPFGGAGTTGLCADRLGRNAILIELNPAYVEIARKRLTNDAGMFAEVAA